MYVPGVCVGVLVDEVDGVPLVDSDEAMLVGVWPCVAVVVSVGEGVLVVGSVMIHTYTKLQCVNLHNMIDVLLRHAVTYVIWQ